VTTLETKATSTAARPVTAPAAKFPAPVRVHVLGAIFRRDLFRYFSNPAGYVFITLFVLASSVVAFCLPAFFAHNLANLDQLNQWMPYLLLFFIPAITMSIWADERRQGTDELLLTLPARDVEVVLGKYLAALGIYSIALAFTLSHVAILYWLGRPDPGVLFATYVGYWLMGAMLIAIGMVASLLSSNATVAFILGGLFAAVPVFAGLLGSSSGNQFRRWVEELSVPAQFEDFGRGVIPLEGVFYFVTLAIGMLYVNMVLLGRRHWAGGERSRDRWLHALVRIVSVIIALASLDVLVGRAGARIDATAEGLHTLTAQSKAMIDQIPADRPVLIQAYLSPDVPREYVETKANLVDLLKEYAARGGSKIRLNLIDTDLYSPQAREAETRFGIKAQRVFTTDQARQSSEEIYLGVAFTSGPEEVVIPFFDRGLPVEYELTRSIGVVSKAKRKRVGILSTDAKLLGGFDFQAMGRQDEWQIVTELKKQYEVTSVSADSEIPDNFDVLLVAQPSSMTQLQIDNLVAYIRKGKPTLLLMDPFPVVDRTLAPSVPKMPPGGMFGGQPPPPKGDLSGLLDVLGIGWPDNEVVWDPYNPHPQIVFAGPEIVFIGPGSGAKDAFNPKDPTTSGLQEVVVLFAGRLRERGSPAQKFIPLLRTSDQGGILTWSELTTPGLFGLGLPDLNPNRVHIPSGEAYTLAARLQGPPSTEAEKSADAAKDKDPAKAKKAAKTEIHAIVIADLDLISDQFFELRNRAPEELRFFNFDNVTFILNCVDVLAGDESFIALRKRRPRHRTLEAIEEQSQVFIKKSEDEEKVAEQEAKDQLQEAQKRLDAKVADVRDRKDLDKRTKEIMLENLERVENRRLEVAKAEIEDKKRQKIQVSRAEKETAIRNIQNGVRLRAVLLPPLPALILGGLVFGIRLSRENRGAGANRLV
jgi:ABC-2 type transport system permease protein